MLGRSDVRNRRERELRYDLRICQRTVRSSGVSIGGCWAITESTRAVSCAHPAVAFSAAFGMRQAFPRAPTGKPRSANDGVPDRACYGLRRYHSGADAATEFAVAVFAVAGWYGSTGNWRRAGRQYRRQPFGKCRYAGRGDCRTSVLLSKPPIRCNRFRPFRVWRNACSFLNREAVS